MSFDVASRKGWFGFRAAGLLVGGLVTTMVANACVVTNPDPNYCSNVTGDFFCRHHYGAAAPFCVEPSTTCLSPFNDEIQGKLDFDGCVSSRPDADECYSPCGYEKTFDQESDCIEDATGTEADTGSTTVSSVTIGSTEGTSGVDGTVTTDSTTTGSTTTGSTTTDSTTTDSTTAGSTTGDSTTTSSTTTTDSTTEGSTTTGEGCSMWEDTMIWGGCLTDLNVQDPIELCDSGAAAMCVLEGVSPAVTHSTCAVPCVGMDPCSCPEPPASGTASVTCGDIDGTAGEECYLDCSNNEVCPDGMECVDSMYCAAPAEPAPMYGDCIAGCALPGQCAQSADGARVCVSPCYDDASCADSPESMVAVPACGGAIAPPFGDECHLDCWDEATMAQIACPTGMVCIAPSVSVLDPPPTVYQHICMWPG